MNDPTPWRLFIGWSLALLLTTGGALGVVLTIRNGIFLGRLHRRGVRTPGTVVRHETAGSGTDQPVLQFADQHDRLHTFTSTRPANTFLPLGQQREVVYFPERPEKARLYRTSTAPLQRIWPVLLSALFLGIGLVMTAALAGVRFPRPTDGTAFALFVVLSSLALGTAWVIVLSSIGNVVSLRRNGLRTSATVIRSGDKDSIVVEFTDGGGHAIQFTDMKKLRVGTRVQVVHSEQAPEQAKIDSLSRPLGMVAFLLVVTLPFLASLFVVTP